MDRRRRPRSRPRTWRPSSRSSRRRGPRAISAIIGTTLQIVGETLCEAADLRSGSKVLDVAAGNGNCSLAAARRWCDVTSTDYVPALLEDGRRRAAAERLPITFREADVEALPFADGSFDVVLSSFGVMFAPDHRAVGQRDAARRAQRRHHRPRQLDAGRLHRPPVRRDRPPRAAAGRRDAAVPLGPARAPRAAVRRRGRADPARRRATSCSAIDRRPTGSRSSGPGTARCTRRSRRCRPKARPASTPTCTTSSREFNEGGDGTMVVPAEYLEVVIVKR